VKFRETASAFNAVRDFFVVMIVVIIFVFGLFIARCVISTTIKVTNKPLALGFKLGVLFSSAFARDPRRLRFASVW
jgi:hypothetical protein